MYGLSSRPMAGERIPGLSRPAQIGKNGQTIAPGPQSYSMNDLAAFGTQLANQPGFASEVERYRRQPGMTTQMAARMAFGNALAAQPAAVGSGFVGGKSGTGGGLPRTPPVGG
jgi:hypothetical protein